MPSNACSSALHRKLLLVSFLLAPAPPALAATPAPTHPALAVQRWRAAFTVVVSYSGRGIGGGGATPEFTLHHSSGGSVVLSRTGSTSWSGKGSFQGSATERLTLKGDAGKVEQTLLGAGSDTGVASLGVSAREGTWRFSFPSVSVPAKTRSTVSGGGRTYTRTGEESVLVECSEPVTKPSPLPSGDGLTATFRGKRPAGKLNMGPADIVCTVQLYPVGKEPKPQAVAGGPYRVQRGGTITLDASGSKGTIQKYVWEVSGPRCGDGRGAIESPRREGAKWSFVALCGLDAKLTVTDAIGATSTDTARVEVDPREWRTPFEHAGEQPTDFGPLAMTCQDAQAQVSGLSCPNPQEWVAAIVGGANVCARGDTGGATHAIHPDMRQSGDGTAYRVKQVMDPGGPFHLWHYADEYLAEVRRQTLVNSRILPGTRFYEDNASGGNDVAGYLQAVKMHEGLGGRGADGHAKLMKLGLEAQDPARDVEKMVSGDRTAVVRKADQALRDAERRICQRAKDPLAQTWSGSLRVWRPDGNGYIVGTTRVGGRGAPGASPCD